MKDGRLGAGASRVAAEVGGWGQLGSEQPAPSRRHADEGATVSDEAAAERSRRRRQYSIAGLGL